MEHIKHQLNINLNKNGLMQIAASSQVCLFFEEIKSKVIDPSIECTAISFKNSTLKIQTDNSITATEVRIRAEKIKKELNKKLKRDTVIKIEVTF